MDVELAEAESHKLEIVINDPKSDPDPGGDPTPKPDPDPDNKEPETEMKRLPAYILAGVGVLSFIGSGVFWGLREAQLGAIAENCEDEVNLTGCRPEDREPADRAQAYDTTAKVLLGVGAASLASGVVLWFVLEPEGGTATTGNTKKKVSVAPLPGGLLISGQF
jgi:hypothetical protein